MAQLGLTGSELSVDLCDGSGLHSSYSIVSTGQQHTTKDLVELFASCGNVNNVLSLLLNLCGLQHRSRQRIHIRLWIPWGWACSPPVGSSEPSPRWCPWPRWASSLSRRPQTPQCSNQPLAIFWYLKNWCPDPPASRSSLGRCPRGFKNAIRTHFNKRSKQFTYLLFNFNLFFLCLLHF